jgi:hypothetical protein
MVDILGAIGNAASQAGAAISSGFNDYVARSQSNLTSQPAQQQSSPSNNGSWGSQVSRAVSTAGDRVISASMIPAAIAVGAVGGAVSSYLTQAVKAQGNGYNAEGYKYVPSEKPASASDTKQVSTVENSAPSGEFTATYSEENIDRPGYTKIADLGLDRKTWAMVAKGSTPLKAVTKRLETETNPRIRRELDWQQGKLLQNDIEASSAEHHYKMDSINPADWTFNTRENVGDMALAIKEGTRQENKLQIARSNPAVMGVMQTLPEKDYVPGGMGWGDITWENAKSGYSKKSPSLLPAVDILETARKNKDYGVYGTLSSNKGSVEWNPASTRTRKVPAYEPTDYFDYNNTGEYRLPKSKTVKVGEFGRRPKIGKVVRRTVSTESDILQEMGLTQPFNKKQQRDKPLGKVKYSPEEKDNFQSMRKNYTNHPPKKATYTNVNETDILKEMGIMQELTQKTGKNQSEKGRKTKMAKMRGI